MIHTDRAIVVEGKYDKIKLGGLIDGVILCTGGFRIYKDKEMQAMLRTLANKQGFRSAPFCAASAGRRTLSMSTSPTSTARRSASSTPPGRASWGWRASRKRCCSRPWRTRAWG